MKKLITSLALLASLSAINAQTLSVYNTSSSGSITCSNANVTLVAAVIGYSATPQTPTTFSWSSGGPATTGSVATITTPGSYTVTALFNTSTLSSVYVIGINTVAPFSVVTPISQTITCTNAAVSVSAAATPTVNVSHYWFSPSTYSISDLTMMSGSFLSVFPVGAPGVYTNVVVNNLNGCSTIKTFTVASTSNFPTQDLASLNNFTVGCSTHSICNIQINGNTSPAGGAMSYALLAPGFTGTYTPNNTSNYNVTVPGTYTVVIRDIVSGCESKFPFSVIQDISAPTASVIVPSQSLSCYLPSVTLTALSNLSSLSYLWQYPGGSSATANANVNAASPNTSPSAGNYSLNITNTINGCSATATVINMAQNLFAPHAIVGGSTAISCSTPSITLTNISSTGIPPSSGFPTNAPVVAVLWDGPVPQTSVTMTYSYLATTPGVYSLTVQDYNNGCQSTTMIAIGDNRMYPIIAALESVVLCGNSVTITPNVTSPPAPLSYIWTPPQNATISPSPSAGTITVSSEGEYMVIVTNTLTGCATLARIDVLACTGINSLAANNQVLRIYPNPSADGVFTISNTADNSTVEIYNGIGTLVLKQSIGKDAAIDMKNAASGVYFIHVISNNKAVYTSRLIKQ